VVKFGRQKILVKLVVFTDSFLLNYQHISAFFSARKLIFAKFTLPNYTK